MSNVNALKELSGETRCCVAFALFSGQPRTSRSIDALYGATPTGCQIVQLRFDRPPGVEGQQRREVIVGLTDEYPGADRSDSAEFDILKSPATGLVPATTVRRTRES